MKKEDLILKLKNLGCLNLCAIEIMTAILKNDLKMELLKSIQLKTSLGDINFKRGMNALLDNDILVWVQEKSHRKKVLYYGEAFIAMGAKQIVKNYVLESEKNKLNAQRLLNLKNQGYKSKELSKFDAIGSAWKEKGKTYDNPHYTAIKEEDREIPSEYLITSIEGFKQRFMAQYSKRVKVPTEHLYRKSLARYVPQSSTK